MRRYSLWIVLGGLAGLFAALCEGAGAPARVLVAGAWLYALTGAAAAGCLRRLLPGRGRPPRRRLAGGLAAAAVLAALASAWATRAPARGAAAAGAPELLLITCDTTRADRWEAVARLAASRGEEDPPWEGDAVVFSRAYAPAALTAPSHASLLTGRHPHEHGLFNNGAVLAPWPRLPELLRSAGWTTLAAPSVIHLDPGFGFDRGFDGFAAVEGGLPGALRPLQRFALVRALLRLTGAGRAARPGAATLAEAQRLWEGADPDRPRFLWIHVFEPHWPYEPPAGALAAVEAAPPWPAAVATPGFSAGRVAGWRRRYDAEILAARRLLRAFAARCEADARARGRELWTIFTSDHGEALGDHGSVDHGDLLYEEQVRVPLWIRGPDSFTAREVEAPVSHVDLLPSLAELLDLPLPPGLGGRSWAPALRGGTLPARPVYAATRHTAFDNVMIVAGGWKLIRNHRWARAKFLRRPDGRAAKQLPETLPWTRAWEAYDLGRDPFEQHPVEKPLQAAGRRLGEGLQAFDQARGRPGPVQGLSPDVIESLRELGYF